MVRSNTMKYFSRHGLVFRSSLPAVALLLIAGLSHHSAAAEGLDEIRAAIRVRDFGTAVPLLETLANSGNPDAQYQLAALYRAGSGVTKDHEIAFYWLTKAADQNQKQAQYNLGIMYENGWGTPASAKDAVYWYEKAAAQGHPMARHKTK
jgi:TPR repeat protein